MVERDRSRSLSFASLVGKAKELALATPRPPLPACPRERGSGLASAGPSVANVGVVPRNANGSVAKIPRAREGTPGPEVQASWRGR